MFDKLIYEVWINELAIEDASQQAWDHCLEQARICDIFITLSTETLAGQIIMERLEFAMPNS